MKLIYSDPALRCDFCGAIRRDADEPSAQASGWLVQAGADPHVHICPRCAAAEMRRRAAAEALHRAA
jgi:hypothetical protein